MTKATRKDLVERYGRAIIHMRQLVQKRKLGLALGSGVSQSANFPSWTSLLERITAALNAKGYSGPDLAREPAPMQAQILFARFRQGVLNGGGLAGLDVSHHDAEIATRWRDVLREALYRDVVKIDELINTHPYLKELAKLAFKVPVVVSYNYDELLERSLSISDSRPDGTLGYYSA